jgi:hypothetical protein
VTRVRDRLSEQQGKSMKSVEQLDVFKLAHELTLRVYKITLGFPREESFALVSQMRRAASSIGMNLVEGSMRRNKRELRQFVGIARGSAAGLITNSFWPRIWVISRKRFSKRFGRTMSAWVRCLRASPSPSMITRYDHSRARATSTICV